MSCDESLNISNIIPFLTPEPSEVAKLQKHLSLLRQEYVKLQSKMVEMEQKLSLASAASGNLEQDSFIAQLLRLVADLHDKDSFRFYGAINIL